MTDVLIYWRDYRRNREGSIDGQLACRWHSNAGWLSELVAGDRLWMVTSGAAAGGTPHEAGFLVDLWTVVGVTTNPGDDPEYPRNRYRSRIECSRSSQAPRVPVNVDSVLRPETRPRHLSIGRYLQGPRRLSPERRRLLEQAIEHPPINPSPIDPSDVAGAPELIAKPASVEILVEQQGLLPTGTPAQALAGNTTSEPSDEIDRSIVALGIRQPWAELILRGVKTVEVRTLETNHRGPIYLYTSKIVADTPAAQAAIQRHRLDVAKLPTGLLVGTVEIVDCRDTRSDDAQAACLPASLLPDKRAWIITNPHRLKTPLRPRFLPYGVWFYPFRRKNGADSS